MKKLLLTIIVLACSANLAFAQNGSVGLFSVNDGTNCEYFDVAPGLASIYAVWVGHGGGTAIQFRAVMPACFTAAVWLSDTAIWPVTIGPSQVGVAVGFGQCVPAPVHVLTINVFAQGIAHRQPLQRRPRPVHPLGMILGQRGVRLVCGHGAHAPGSAGFGWWVVMGLRLQKAQVLGPHVVG